MTAPFVAELARIRHTPLYAAAPRGYDFFERARASPCAVKNGLLRAAARTAAPVDITILLQCRDKIALISGGSSFIIKQVGKVAAQPFTPPAAYPNRFINGARRPNFRTARFLSNHISSQRSIRTGTVMTQRRVFISVAAAAVSLSPPYISAKLSALDAEGIAAIM